MELNLDVEKINYMELLLEKSVIQDEMTEVIVPDALPDAAEIICTEGTAFLRGKDADESCVRASGVVEATVFYVPEDGEGVRKLDITLPFTVSAESEKLSEESLLTAKVSVKRISAGILNPRKLSVHVEIMAELRAYLPAETCIYRKEDKCDEVEVLEKSITAEVAAEISEKTFIISDELAVSSSKPEVGEILLVSSKIGEDEVKGIGSKLVVRGRITTEVLYMPVDGGCPETVKFTSPFSQIVEFVGSCEDNAGDVILALTGTYVSRGMPNANGETVLELEVHCVAQCVSYKNVEVKYIADAYSTKYDIECLDNEIALPGVIGRFSVTKTIVGGIEVPLRPKDIVCVTVKPGSGTVIDGTISADVDVCVIYLNDSGELSAAHKVIRAEAECDMKPDGKTMVSVEWEGESFVNIVGNTLEIRFPVRFRAITMSSAGVRAVSSVSFDEENQKDTSCIPSLVVYRTRGGDDLWMLGKRFCSTSELILGANGLEGNAAMPEGVTIVIPKKR